MPFVLPERGIKPLENVYQSVPYSVQAKQYKGMKNYEEIIEMIRGRGLHVESFVYCNMRAGVQLGEDKIGIAIRPDGFNHIVVNLYPTNWVLFAMTSIHDKHLRDEFKFKVMSDSDFKRNYIGPTFGTIS